MSPSSFNNFLHLKDILMVLTWIHFVHWLYSVYCMYSIKTKAWNKFYYAGRGRGKERIDILFSLYQPQKNVESTFGRQSLKSLPAPPRVSSVSNTAAVWNPLNFESFSNLFICPCSQGNGQFESIFHCFQKWKGFLQFAQRHFPPLIALKKHHKNKPTINIFTK